MKNRKEDILYTVVGGIFWVMMFVVIILGRWIVFWATGR